MRNYYFPKRLSGSPSNTLSKLYEFPLVFYPFSAFEAVYCYISGRRRVVVARYRMICLVLLTLHVCVIILWPLRFG